MDRFFQRLAKGLALIGSLALLFSMGVTLVSTAAKNARRGLDGLDASFGKELPSHTWHWVHSILGEEELVALLIGFALLSTMPLAQLTRSHIQVDLFKPVLPMWLNKLVEFATNALFSALLFGVLWYQWLRVVKRTRGDKPGFWDHALNLDLAAMIMRLKPGNTQILNIPKAWILMGAECLVAVALLISLYCTLQSLQKLFYRKVGHD